VGRTKSSGVSAGGCAAFSSASGGRYKTLEPSDSIPDGTDSARERRARHLGQIELGQEVEWAPERALRPVLSVGQEAHGRGGVREQHLEHVLVTRRQLGGGAP
jgi:hypothetical protein